MSTLVNDVVLYDELVSDTEPFAPILLNLATFCLELVETYQRKSNCAIDFSHDGSCEAACVDANLMQQILDHLLSYTAQYAPDTPVQMTLHCEGDRTIICIHNESVSILPAQQAKLFEPFYRRLDATHAPSSGLDLAIAKKAVDRHHGEITVESNVQHGTTFRVTLPC